MNEPGMQDFSHAPTDEIPNVRNEQEFREKLKRKRGESNDSSDVPRQNM